jgi:hypothetical protein
MVVAGPARLRRPSARRACAGALAWTEQDQRVFMAKFGAAWRRDVPPSFPSGLADIDPALITGWIVGAARGASPRIDPAGLGRPRRRRPGSTIIESLDAYLGRILSQEERQSAEAAALVWLEGRAGVFSDQALRRGTPTSDLVEAGILARREGGSYSFSQPALGAYLGARAMIASGPSEAIVRGGWPPAEAAVGFFAAMSDASDRSALDRSRTRHVGDRYARCRPPAPLRLARRAGVRRCCDRWRRSSNPPASVRPAVARSTRWFRPANRRRPSSSAAC